MQTVRLNNGAELPVMWCVPNADSLGICVSGGHAVREMAEAFGDPEATGVITLVAEGSVDTFVGYTHLCGVYEAGWSPSDIQISLRRD